MKGNFLYVIYRFNNPIEQALETFISNNNISNFEILYNSEDLYRKINKKLCEGYNVWVVPNTIVSFKKMVDINLEVNTFISDDFFILTNKFCLDTEINKTYCSKKIKQVSKTYNYIFSNEKNTFIDYNEYLYGIHLNFDLFVYLYHSEDEDLQKIAQIIRNLQLDKERYRRKVFINRNKYVLINTAAFIKATIYEFLSLRNKNKIYLSKSIFCFWFLIGMSTKINKKSDIYINDELVKSFTLHKFYFFVYNYHRLDEAEGILFNINIKNGEHYSPIINHKYNKYYNYNNVKANYKGKNYIYYTRNTINGKLVIQKKLKYPFEDSALWELKVLAGYILSKFVKTDLVFYEKNISKFDESSKYVFETIDVESKYIAIMKESNQFIELKNKYGSKVIHPGQLKYYIRIFGAKFVVGTEVPGHLSTLRTSNFLLRRKLQTKPTVFLQHGIMMALSMKTDERAFFKKDGLYNIKMFITSSEAEKEHITQYGYFEREKIINTGLPTFVHKNKPKNQKYITIMHTWRKWEEARIDVEQTTYYNDMMELREIALKSFPEDIIKVIWHPKMSEKMNYKDQSISDILSNTKVLITDYSSVSFDAFYRGSNVIFDFRNVSLNTEKSSNTLMYNENMAFGDVIHHLDDVPSILEKNYYNGQEERYINRYKLFNEHSDGNNALRVSEEIKKKLNER